MAAHRAALRLRGEGALGEDVLAVEDAVVARVGVAALGDRLELELVRGRDAVLIRQGRAPYLARERAILGLSSNS
eukprot:2031703-Prymnesium_polylepis.1